MVFEVYIMIKDVYKILKRTPDIETVWPYRIDKPGTSTITEFKLRRQPDIEDDLKAERNQINNPTPQLIPPLMLARSYFDKFRKERDFVWLDILRAAVSEEELISITRMNRIEFDQWRNRNIKAAFLSKLTTDQKKQFNRCVKISKRTINFEKSLNIEQRSLYKRWVDKKIPLVPPFFKDMKLDKQAQAAFLKLCASKDFVSLHYFMAVYGKFELLYSWWERAAFKIFEESN